MLDLQVKEPCPVSFVIISFFTFLYCHLQLVPLSGVSFNAPEFDKLMLASYCRKQQVSVHAYGNLLNEKILSRECLFHCILVWYMCISATNGASLVVSYVFVFYS